MDANQQPAPPSVSIWASTTVGGRIHRLTGKPPIRFTSTRRHRFRWQRNQGGNPPKKCPEPVQTNRTTSHHRQADDLGASLEVAKEAAFCHPTKLYRRAARLNQVSSDSARPVNNANLNEREVVESVSFGIQPQTMARTGSTKRG